MQAETRLLLLSAANAVTSLNALGPLSRRGGSSLLSFGSGLLASEAPLPLLATQAATTARFVQKHGLSWRSPRTLAALGINAVSWAGLVAAHRQATKASQHLDAAVVDELGFDLRATDPVATPANAVRDALVPVPDGRRKYCTDPDISYGPHGRRNRLDVWRPDGATNAPVLLQIHGGAWCTGEKEQQGIPLMTEMVQRGWVCVAVNYRLSPDATWPDHIVDVKRALAWIRDNITDYGGNPDYVAVTGGSAGGHLAALTALSAGDPLFQPDFEDADTSVQAAVPVYGVYDFLDRDRASRDDLKAFIGRLVMKSEPDADAERWEAASPMSRVAPDAPPFMILHGTNDSIVPVEQARVFADRLRHASDSPVVYAELPGAQHAFEMLASVRAAHTVRAVGRFLDHCHHNWIEARQAQTVS